MKRFLPVAFLLLVIACLASTASADTNEDQMRAIAGEFMSPFCPGRVLSDCPSSAASELKAKILADLKSGKTRREVEDQLIAVYGDAALAAPRFSGFGLVSWLGPVVFLVVGLIAAVVWSQRVKIIVRDEKPLTDEERNRVRREI